MVIDSMYTYCILHVHTYILFESKTEGIFPSSKSDRLKISQHLHSSFELHSHDISTNFYNKEISILHIHFKLQNVLVEHNETGQGKNNICILFFLNSLTTGF